MTTYAFSDTGLKPTSSAWSIQSNTKTYRSPLTQAVQTARRGGEYWQCTLNFANLTDADRAKLQAFLVRLNGQEHRVSLNDRHPNRGAQKAVTTALVNGSSETGHLIDTDGWNTSGNPVLSAGDRVQIGNQLVMVVADADQSGGAATLEVRPAIRSAPADNSAVDPVNPLGIFMLATPVVGWSNSRGVLFSDVSIQLVEDVLA